MKPVLPSVGLYNRTRYEIVIETYGHELKDDSFMMTEKVLKPIIMKHPFMIVSTVGFLDKMRRLGYKTFSSHIDESYDDQTDEKTRFEIIGQNISFLHRQDKKYFEEMDSICEHNYNHFLKLQREYQSKLESEIEKLKYEG